MPVYFTTVYKYQIRQVYSEMGQCSSNKSHDKDLSIIFLEDFTVVVLILSWRPFPALEQDAIRILVFKDCDRKGKSLLFDSKSFIKNEVLSALSILKMWYQYQGFESCLWILFWSKYNQAEYRVQALWIEIVLKIETSFCIGGFSLKWLTYSNHRKLLKIPRSLQMTATTTDDLK